MPLTAPPPPSELADLPKVSLTGLQLYRVIRAGRSPWWFASLPAGDHDPGAYGRFDLLAPWGSCYLARTPVAAVLEVFQDFGAGLLPEAELAARRIARVKVPAGAPVAANLAAPSARARGVTAALWAGADRRLTQAWAWALSRGGWRAIQHGIQHDPTGRLRAITLFDEAGDHPPYNDPDRWPATLSTCHDDPELRKALRRYGLSILRDDVALPVISLPDSGLL
jgi:hypothetical protein